jgi:hypothetical protein
MPTATGERPNYDVTLSDGISTVGFLLKEGAGALQRVPTGKGVERVVVGQSDFRAGRGVMGREAETLAGEFEGFHDSRDLWTMTEGKAAIGPFMRWGSGAASPAPWDGRWKEGIAWMPLAASNGYIAFKFTASVAAYTRVEVLLRKVGTPAVLPVVSVATDNAGTPGTVQRSGTVTDWDGRDPTVARVTFATYAPGGAVHWIIVACAGVTDTANCFELGMYFDGGAEYYKSTVGGTTPANWHQTFSYGLNFRAMGTPTPVGRGFVFSYLKASYLILNSADPGTAPRLFLNGDRGIATGVGQTTSKLVDTTKAWTADEWIGCVVTFVDGALAGLSATISDNDATSLTLSGLDAPLPVAPAAGAGGAVYAILGSDKWTEIAGHGLTVAVTDVENNGGFVYFAEGTAVDLRKMREYDNAGTWTRAFAADTGNKAVLLCTFIEGNLQFMYRLVDRVGRWGRDVEKAWASAFAFTTSVVLGETSVEAVNMVQHDGGLAIAREDAIFGLRNLIGSVLVSLGDGRSLATGLGMASWKNALYYSFLDGMQRLWGKEVADVGPNTGTGIPYWRAGVCADLRPVLQFLYAGWDSRSGLSAVYVSTGGEDWHEIWRLPYGWSSAAASGSGDATVGRTVTVAASERLRAMGYQYVPGGPCRLWMQLGGQIGGLLMPESTADVAGGQSWPVTWAGHLVTGWCEFGDIGLDKYFDELTITADYLYSGQGEVWVEYQLDNADDTSAWTWLGKATTSPRSTLSVGQTGYRIRFKLTLFGSYKGKPPELREWSLRADVVNEALFDFRLNVEVEDRAVLLDGSQSHDRVETPWAVLHGWEEKADALTLRYRRLSGVVDNVLVHLVKSPLEVLQDAPGEADGLKVGGVLVLRQVG